MQIRYPHLGPAHLVVVAVLVLVLAVFWQAGEFGPINFDDGYIFSGTSRVPQGLTLNGARWAFTSFHMASWQPLTWLSHMVDVELFGSSPGWHHRTNVLLHLLNAELLFLVLWRLSGGLWKSAFVSALFAVHPLHVESVAWLTARKDVLSTLFWILSMGAYVRYARLPGAARYLAVVVLFALGLMAKPMLVTLPFVLLLLDFWPLGRLAGANTGGGCSWPISARSLHVLVVEKVPLLALSVASSVLTFLAQSREGAVAPLEVLSVGTRIANALAASLAYLGKTMWPASLAFYYPLPANTPTSLPVFEMTGALLLLTGISWLLLWHYLCRPYLAVGWLWYLGTLVPVVGLVQVGTHAMADRFTYIPLIGIFIAAAWGISGSLEGWRWRRLALGTAGFVLVVVLSRAAWVQTGYWRDSVTLASRALAVTPGNWLAASILGLSLAQRGQFDQAILWYQEALRRNPSHAKTWQNLGVALASTAQLPQAIAAYQAAVRLEPEYAEAWNNLCAAFAQSGQFSQAIDACQQALRVRPDYPTARQNLGMALQAQQQRSLPSSHSRSP